MKRFLLAAVLTAAAPMVASANVVLNFSNPTGDLGTSHTYTNGTASVTAYGYQIGGAARDLYGKFTSGDPTESGVGLAENTPDHEIDDNHIVALDTTSLKANGYTDLTVTIGSDQTGEGFAIYGTNTLGATGTLLVEQLNPPATDPTTEDIGTLGGWGYTYINISGYPGNPNGDPDNVVLMSATAIPGTSVPVPASAAMGLVTMLGLGAVMALRRRQMA